jgi:hypothetical protein
MASPAKSPTTSFFFVVPANVPVIAERASGSSMIEDATNRLVTTARQEQFEPLTHVAPELDAPSIKSRHGDVTTGCPDPS